MLVGLSEIFLKCYYFVATYHHWHAVFVQETMSKEHAMRFPFIGSAVLLSLFLLFKFLPKDLINTVLTLYFFVLGVLALSCVLLTFTTVMFRMSLQRSARLTSPMLVRAVLGTQYLGSHSRDDDFPGVLTTIKSI